MRRLLIAMNLDGSPGFNLHHNRFSRCPPAPQPLQQASEPTISSVELQANSQVEESFDEHSIQRLIEEITGAFKEALYPEENASTENDRTPRKMLPSTACALVG